MKETPEYAQKIKEIRETESRIAEESRRLMYAEKWRDDCETEISEWSAGAGFFARWRPPPEIREKKEQAEQARTNIRQISGILSGLRATFELAKKLFKEWFQAEVNSPKLDARWRYRSLALDGIKRECETRLAEDRAARVEARLREDMKLYREAEAIRKERLEQEAQRQKSQVVGRKQKVEPPPRFPILLIREMISRMIGTIAHRSECEDLTGELAAVMNYIDMSNCDAASSSNRFYFVLFRIVRNHALSCLF